MALGVMFGICMSQFPGAFTSIWVSRRWVSGGSQPVPGFLRVVGVITVDVKWKAMLWLLASPKIRSNIQGHKAMSGRCRPCMQK